MTLADTPAVSVFWSASRRRRYLVFAAVTLGAAYRGARWSWNGRAEYRSSERADRYGVTSNALCPLEEGKTLAASLRWFRVEQASGAVAATSAADVALAWRPLDSRWSVLERFT